MPCQLFSTNFRVHF